MKESDRSSQRDYEEFLAQHYPEIRRALGVYYTPEPVVSYIVRSVELLLQSHLSLQSGYRDPSVVVVDPACGTGVFLSSMLYQARQHFLAHHNKADWHTFVTKQLSQQWFGFDLMKEPVAIARQILSTLANGEDLAASGAHDWTCSDSLSFPGLQARNAFVSSTWQEELPSASTFVVVGNPPYLGHSENKEPWIHELLRGKQPDGSSVASYYEIDGKRLEERNVKWLQDDYVKFIRLSHWWLEQSRQGVLAFVCNNGFLDNPTFRGMRQQLLQTFDTIYLLNLHGNARRREKTPEGTRDENVFSILQGVVILLAVKASNSRSQGTLLYADSWGLRDEKLMQLSESDITSTTWEELTPCTPFYFFVPHDVKHQASYQKGWKVTDIFPIHSVGIATARDRLTIHWTPEEALHTAQEFIGMSEEEARAHFDLGKDVRDWKVASAQEDLRQIELTPESVYPIHYRPMDTRYTCYTGRSRGFHCMPRTEVMRHLLQEDNLALITSRMTKGEDFHHVQASRHLVEVICMSSKTSNNGFVFPLYLYPESPTLSSKQRTRYPLWKTDEKNRIPNLNPEFVTALEVCLALPFVTTSTNGKDVFAPEDILAYLYAILHAPSYREQYAAFLRVDFPRIPLPSDTTSFRTLHTLGHRLLQLHLWEASNIKGAEPSFPIEGDNVVAKGYPKYEEVMRRVWINATQYWEGIEPEIWEFRIGGYQVCRKWLHSRRQRTLSSQEILHFQTMVATLDEMMEVMKQIDLV